MDKQTESKPKTRQLIVVPPNTATPEQLAKALLRPVAPLPLAHQSR